MDNPFVHRLKNKSDDELKNMIRFPSGFNPLAIDAASIILSEREKNNSEYKEPIIEPERNKEKEALIKVLSKANVSLKALAGYQLVGSLLILPYYRNIFDLSFSWVTIVLLLFLTTHILGIVGSVLLFQKKEAGILITQIIQATQLIQFSAFNVKYYSVGLFAFFINLPGFPGFGLQLKLLSPSIQFSLAEHWLFLGVRSDFLSYFIQFSLSDDTFFLGVNMVSLLALVVLHIANKHIKRGVELEHILDDNLFKRNEPDV